MIIKDDGLSLTEEQIDKAFKRDQRFDGSKPGTGLGLAIVSGMVSEYGGSFSLPRSELGRLYTKIVLPR